MKQQHMAQRMTQQHMAQQRMAQQRMAHTYTAPAGESRLCSARRSGTAWHSPCRP
jgi:hypothetical protein